MSSHLNHLPETAKRLIADLGMADAMKVIATLGGSNLTIPPPGTVDLSSHFLIERLGERLAAKLAEHYGGATSLFIPNCAALRKAERDANIISRHRAEVAKGHGLTYSAAVVALEFGITSSYVKRLIKGVKTA